MSSRYSKSVYKDLGEDAEPVDFDFFDDGESEKREYQSDKQPLLSSTPVKQTSASTSYSPRSTDLESARSAASSRSSLNVRVPSASPSHDDISSDESEDDYKHNSKQIHSDSLKPVSNKNSTNKPVKYERPKTCKPGSRTQKTETVKKDDVSDSDSGSYSSSFTSDSSYSSDNAASSGSDSDTDSGSVTDVSPLQSPNSTGEIKKLPDENNEKLQQKRPLTSKVNSRERHQSEGGTRITKKENVRFAGEKKPNGHKAAPGSRWNESEAQELSMLLRAVLEMEDAPKTLVQMSGRQRSRPTSAKSTISNASMQSLPHKRMNMSFSNDRVRQIDRENQRLLQQIMKKSGVDLGSPKGKTKPKKAGGSQTAVGSANGTHKPVLSHAAMRRQREQRRIEIENMQILKRIDSAKASREVTKDALLEDHYRMTRYAQQVSKSPLRPTSAKSPSGKQSMSETASLLSLYSNDSVSSKAGSRSSSRPTSAKKSGYRPSTRQPRQAWDDHWQS